MLLIKGAREGAYRGSGSEKKFVKCPYPPYNKENESLSILSTGSENTRPCLNMAGTPKRGSLFPGEGDL